MSDNTYNGWTNYATWRVNLELLDGVTLEEFGIDDVEGAKCTDVHELADALQSRCEEYVEESSGKGIARDYALAFLSDVNWYEIAEHIVEDYIREQA